MSESQHDKGLTDYLKRDSEISQRYREIHDDVPHELDRRVLNMARAAGNGARNGDSPRIGDSPRWRRWSVPAALAASTLLALSIVIESGVYRDTVQVQAPAAPPAARNAEEMLTKEPSASGLLDRATQDERAKPLRQAPEAAKKPAAAAPPAPSLADAPEEREEVTVSNRRVEQVAQDSPASVVVVEPEFVAQVEPLLESAPAHESTAATTMRPSAPREQPSSDNATDAAGASHDLSEVVVTGALRRAPTPSAGPRGTIAQSRVDQGRVDQAEPAHEAAEESAREAEDTAPADAERWLEAIRELRRTGQHIRADEEWKRFRRAYPAYAVVESDLARPQEK